MMKSAWDYGGGSVRRGYKSL